MAALGLPLVLTKNGAVVGGWIDIKLFNAAFLCLGIVGVIVIALIAFQPDGYQRFLKFIEITSEGFEKFSNIMNELLSFWN